MGQNAARTRGCPLSICITAPFAVLGLGFALVLNIAGSTALSTAIVGETRLFVDIFGKRLTAYLDAFFRDPLQAAGTTAERVRIGHLAPADAGHAEEELVPQIRNYPWLTFVAIGMPDGSYLSASRSPENGALLLFESGPRTVFRQYRREIDEDNDEAGTLLAIGQHYDARATPWFTEALTARSTFWSPPHILDPYGLYGMVVSVPVRDASGKLMAVVRGAVALQQVSRFLRESLPDATTLAFLLDTSGRLLASSSTIEKQDASSPLSGPESSADPLLGDAGRAMMREGPTARRFVSGGRTWGLERFAYRGIEGLALDIGIVTDESKFVGPLMEFRRAATLLVLIAALAIAITGYFVGRTISAPVIALKARAARIADGDWTARPTGPAMSREVGELSVSFERMAATLRETFDGLEAKVADRTAALETLLQEVNHRIKNTLNVAASLLGLQGALAASPDTSTALDEAAARIKSMSLLYSRLHLDADLENVDVGSYISAVLDALEGGTIGPRPIRVERSIESMVLSAKLASPLGIIVNELFTNACKYAFPEGRAGTVSVRVSRRERGVLFEVSDDGIGFPESFDPLRNGGFGLTVAGELAQDMGGRMTVERLSPGSRISIEIDPEIAR